MEVRRIEDQLKRAFEGPAWHGPSVLETLGRVTAARAAARPIRSAHTIWEIALHIAVWEDVVRRRIGGEAVSLTSEQDWPPVKKTGAAAWKGALASLRRGHRALRDAVARLPESRLAEKVGSRGTAVYVLLHGAIQHDLYHAGQIAILKKAKG